MLSVLNKGRVPVKLWAHIHEVESGALDQLTNLSTLPFVFKHVAAMADVHQGYGTTVGSVFATENAVIPQAIGSDIGCGMAVHKLPYKLSDLPDNLDALYSDIEWGVPTGHNQHKTPLSDASSWVGWGEINDNFSKKIQDNLPKALSQLGTLGGGNHFIEVCGDEEQNVWVMLHSGSRYIGKMLADYHINEAKGLMKKMMISLPDPLLAYLVTDTPEFNSYWFALQWAQKYAMKNRELMMTNVMKSMSKVLLGDHKAKIEPLISINCHHNYAEMENHYGKNVYVTRKGAVRARREDYGIIPGSMGTRSYIVRGKGNEESFCSCSHGAGRRYSRTKAKEHFTLEDFEKQTQGVRCKKDASVLDEIPGAYKDIDQVMENQKDLVEVIAVLKQVLCVKG
jgi:tRNA-splicing ligase RtcB